MQATDEATDQADLEREAICVQLRDAADEMRRGPALREQAELLSELRRARRPEPLRVPLDGASADWRDKHGGRGT